MLQRPIQNDIVEEGERQTKSAIKATPRAIHCFGRLMILTICLLRELDG